MNSSISGVKKLADGIWQGTVSTEDRQFFSGRPAETADKNVVLLTNPTFSEGMLSFRLASARIVVRGNSQETIFIDAESVGKSEASVAGRSPKVFWVTVGSGLQGNLDLGLKSNTWGVEANYRERLAAVKPDDFVLFYGSEIGFMLCLIESALIEDCTQIWPDGVYPYRIRISNPLLISQKKFSDVSRHIRDNEGVLFNNAHASARAISGRGGVFRRLSPNEVQDIFSELGWKLPTNSVVVPT